MREDTRRKILWETVLYGTGTFLSQTISALRGLVIAGMLEPATYGLWKSIQVGLDPDDKTATAYGIDDLPATVFVTADGQILERDTGPLAAEHLERRIRSVIAEGPD